MPTSPYRRIWEIAWPVSISTSTVTLLTLANLFWIGHLGTEAVAALSLCGNLLFTVFGITSIVHTGALAIVSRRVGEGDLARAHTSMLHGIVLGLGLGIVVASAGYAIAPAVVHFFGAAPEVERIAVTYLRIMLIGQVPFFVSMGFGAGYQAAGDTRTPMLVNVTIVILNAILDPFFIFSPGQVSVRGFDLGGLGLGAPGAAIAASLCGASGTTILAAVSVIRGKPFARAAHGRFELKAAELWHMLRIGAPAAMSMAARPLSTFLLLKIIAGFGTAAIAAFGISLRSFSVNWIPYSGINVAVASLVGKSLGARKPTEAERVVWSGLIMTGLLGVLYCIAYFGWADPLIRLFDDEPEVVIAGVPFLRLMAVGFLFSGPTIPLGAAMNGAGDTKPPMVVAFLVNWPVKLPLAYTLAVPMGYGVDGVWIGMFVSIVFEAILLAVWYRRGEWKNRRV